VYGRPMRRDGVAPVLWDAEHAKLLEAVDALLAARERLGAASSCARESSLALRHEAAQAQRRSAELLHDARQLVEQSERLLADARALADEHRLVDDG
jgi:hypothetical protein